MKRKLKIVKPGLRCRFANDPNDLKGELKQIGGSKSDHWNTILANQRSARFGFTASTRSGKRSLQSMPVR